MSARAALSISSVWARVATASRTTVSPLAASPARRTADLTWALATGWGVVDPVQAPAPDHQRGQLAAAPAVHRRPHLAQGTGDAVHGPAAHRIVPGQHGQPRPTGGFTQGTTINNGAVITPRASRASYLS